MRATGADGETVRSPIPGVYLRCAECGDLLRYLIRSGGRALCKSCLAIQAEAMWPAKEKA